jgi:hypothetical protein
LNCFKWSEKLRFQNKPLPWSLPLGMIQKWCLEFVRSPIRAYSYTSM